MVLSPDVVFSVGNLVLALVLLPTVLYSESEVPRWTSAPTFSVLVVFSLTFYFMGLYFSVVVTLVTALMWLFILAWRAP